MCDLDSNSTSCEKSNFFVVLVAVVCVGVCGVCVPVAVLPVS